ncbi:unnamed protein product [Rotaria sp. Silwood2]|nr:unnamed protein product [Rotaria sp. Silwood2]CAF4272530.1 unnamed protein product [Rotaria sp. Silwood2]
MSAETEKYCAKQFDKLCSDVSDFYNSVTKSASNNIEQSDDSSVDQSVNNEQRSVIAANVRVKTNASVRVHEYDYSPNKLRIKQLILSRISSLQNINQYYLKVSYVIPEMYKCTALKKKYLKAIILTDNEQESHIHPNYKFIIDEESVDSILIHVDQYEST